MKKIVLILISLSTFALTASFLPADKNFVNNILTSPNWVFKSSYLTYNGFSQWYSKRGSIQYKGSYRTSQTLAIGDTAWEFVSYSSGEERQCIAPIIITDTGYMTCEDNNYIDHDSPENGNYELGDNGDIGLKCNDGFQNINNSECYEIPENSSGVDPETKKPNCNVAYIEENGFCIPDDTRNPNGTCKDGYHIELNNPQCVADSTPPDDNNNNGGSTGGGDTGDDNNSGSGGSNNDSTGGTGGGTSGGGSSSGSGDTGDDNSSSGGSSGGSGNDGDTVGSSNDGSNGTGGSGSGETPLFDPYDSYVPEPPSEDTGFMCSDNGISLKNDNGFYTCDRICEQIDMITNTQTSKCIAKTSCKDGEIQTGTDLLGNPICWQSGDNTENNTIEGLLADIKNNTKLNKNSNTQLGNLNNKVNSTNAKLEALKGGISQSNSLLDNINTGVTAITDFLKTVTDLLSEPSKIGDKISAKLSDVSNKYTQKFVNETCQPIQTISINYHGENVTFLSQELIDKYFPINIMKTMIILTFAMSGALSFFRGAN